MSQPAPYERATNFSAHQASNPTLPLPAGPLDEEFARIQAVINEIRANLAVIQRDDTEIANRSVGFDQLKVELHAGMNEPTIWATETRYARRDAAFVELRLYRCLETHVSGVFADDLAAGKWTLVADFTGSGMQPYSIVLAALAAALANSPMASQGEAGAGAINNKLMTPLRVKEHLERNLPLVTPEQFGAVGDGIVDDTGAVQEADAYAVAQGLALHLHRTYLVTVNPDTLTALRAGNGRFKRLSRTVPAAPRRVVRNQLWAGHFAVAQEYSALACTSYRRMMLDGMTGARRGFASGVTVFQDVGTYHPFSCRIQRTLGDSSSASFVGAWPLALSESRPYQGRRGFLSFYSQAGANRSGGAATMKVIGHRSSLQPIIRDDGLYDIGTVELASYTWTPGQEIEPWLVPQWFAFDVPADIQQIAFVLTEPYSGTAGADDWIRIEALHSDVGAEPTPMPQASREELMPQAQTRYQSSYPYGVPPGTLTMSNAEIALAQSTAVNFGVVFNVKWQVPMVYPPSVISYSPIEGGNLRIADETAGTRLFAQVFDVSNKGFFITNNAAVTVGNRYRAHWTARAPL